MPAPVHGDTPLDSLRINFSWLTWLRWGALVGQCVVIALVDRLMHVELPLVPLGAILTGQLLLNLGGVIWVRQGRPVHELGLALTMGLDLLLFTMLLYFTGGPTNPFSSLYLIHIALAAVVLPARSAWVLVGVALACSAGLFFDHVPLAMAHDHGEHAAFGWHLKGMWVALGVAASFIVYFLRRIMRALRDRDEELAVARERSLRHERVAGVTTLAAGAAHELASPLTTIEIATGELERTLHQGSDLEQGIADVALIRSQITRCRRILDQLAIDAGQPNGESLMVLSAKELAELAVANLDDGERVLVHATAPLERPLIGPRRAVVQAIRGLLENALHATRRDQTVELVIKRAEDAVRLEVRDRGVGMTREVLERATEPFFSTKGPGRGMGLGLFLAQSVAEQLGGRLELESEPGRGTRAALVLPNLTPATISPMGEARDPAPS